MRCMVECPNKARKLNSKVVKLAAIGMKKVCSERKGKITISFMEEL